VIPGPDLRAGRGSLRPNGTAVAFRAQKSKDSFRMALDSIFDRAEFS
jgi:hypothetical protein